MCQVSLFCCYQFEFTKSKHFAHNIAHMFKANRSIVSPRLRSKQNHMNEELQFSIFTRRNPQKWKDLILC